MEDAKQAAGEDTLLMPACRNFPECQWQEGRSAVGRRQSAARKLAGSLRLKTRLDSQRSLSASFLRGGSKSKSCGVWLRWRHCIPRSPPWRCISRLFIV